MHPFTIQKTDAKDVLNKDPFVLTPNLFGTAPATAGNYGAFYTAPFPCEILAVSAVWETAATGGGSGALQIEKVTGTTAVGSGTTLLATAFDLTSTANTVNYATLTATVLDRQLNRGDRLALRDSGTLTSCAGLQVTVLVKPLQKGHYAIVTSA